MATQPPLGTYEVNTTYLVANIRAIQEHGFHEKWLAGLSPELKAIADDPGTKRWWPGSVNEQLLRALANTCGDAAVDAVGFTSVQRSIGPIVTPLLKVVLAVTGSDPNSIYSRIGQFSSTSSRGVDIGWRPIDATHGETVIQYPSRIDPVMTALWRGGLRCGFTLLKREGMVERSNLSIDGKTLTFLLAWKS